MALDMLRMEDIINYGSKCLPYLIPFLFLLVIACVLLFVTKDGEELSAQAQAFYDFALSEDAAELIAAAGAVPMV